MLMFYEILVSSSKQTWATFTLPSLLDKACLLLYSVQKGLSSSGKDTTFKGFLGYFSTLVTTIDKKIKRLVNVCI